MYAIRSYYARFSEGNKFGTFPSFSAGWRISEESFIADKAWIDNLKLRASWGKLGNQNLRFDNVEVPYPFASVVNLGQNYVFNGTPVPGAALTDMANEKIS